LYTDLNHFYALNDARGRSFGDSIIRWLAIVLREECNSPTYRIGGDDFAVILTDGIRTEYEALLKRIYDRLNKEGEQMGIPTPPTRIALIHFDGDDHVFSINDVMFHLWQTIYDVKMNMDRTVNSYWSQDLIKSTEDAEPEENQLKDKCEILRYIANHAISGVVGMGKALDTAQRDSYLDSISGLPNLRAALLKMEKELGSAAASGYPLSILMIDGDNIRRYNSISYADGDQMIHDMGGVLLECLRPHDFVARWRTGDEFMVILPDTTAEGAKVVGERFCAAIREASTHWRFPTSISIGIATYPKHGNHINDLVDAAETANKRAKDEGKDRVVLSE
jgi:diguanylate cyclase (GGDEF)-like protein